MKSEQIKEITERATEQLVDAISRLLNVSLMPTSIHPRGHTRGAPRHRRWSRKGVLCPDRSRSNRHPPRGRDEWF
jgi:hypothetical protein